MEEPRKESWYKRRKIKAVSYKLKDGGWVARVEVLADTPGAVHPHSVNGSKEFPTQEAADSAAIQMGESWTDSHNPPRAPKVKSLAGFNLHKKLGTKSTKRAAGGVKANGASGNGAGNASGNGGQAGKATDKADAGKEK
jgi:hypothetical protein